MDKLTRGYEPETSQMEVVYLSCANYRPNLDDDPAYDSQFAPDYKNCNKISDCFL